MDDEHLKFDKDEAFEQLEDNSGQSYLPSKDAFDILIPFGGEVTEDFVLQNTLFDEDDIEDEVDPKLGALALSTALEGVQRSSKDARGITNVAPHTMLVTYSDVSAILVKALGGEPSNYTAGGSGFTADGRHDSNVSTLKEQVA